MAVTLKDVARKAEVSDTAVSFVLNNKNVSSVSATKRRRILQVVRELKYRPHAGARSLRSKQFGAVGLFFGSGSPGEFRMYSEFVTGVNEKIAQNGHNMIFHTAQQNQSQEEVVPRMLCEHNVDGIIAVSSVSDDFLEQIKELNVPTIFANTEYWDEVDCIKPDDNGGIYRATRHQIELGHERISYIKAISPHPSVDDRSNGYLRAIQEAGLEPLVLEVSCEGDIQACSNALDGKYAPTAFVSSTFGHAIEMNQAALLKGIVPGKDISLIGGDNGGAGEVTFIDYVHIPFWEMGVRAGELLLKKLENHGPVPSEVVSERMVLRGSSAAPPRERS